MGLKYLNRAIRGDCIELLAAMPNNSVDVAFADPPFNLKKAYAKSNDELESDSYLKWCRKWIYELVRVVKPSGSIFLHNIPKWLLRYSSILNGRADFKHWITWDAPTAPMGNTLQPAHYGILFYAKSADRLKFREIRCPHRRERKSGHLIKDWGGKKSQIHPFGSLASDVWSDIHRVRHNKFRDDHPCQLPIHLLERIILMSSDPGDVILDPFCGTGTTAIAAKRLGRQFVTFDIAGAYVDVAIERLQDTTETKIGAAWVSIYQNRVVTLRDRDWKRVEEFYGIPADVRDVEFREIQFKGPPI